MVNDGHPIYDVRACLLASQPEMVLEFSRYVHLGYGVTKSRDTFHVKAKNLTEEWLTDQLLNLLEGQELALHSRVRYNGNIYHIPMIDFINVLSIGVVTPKLQDVSTKHSLGSIKLYSSGKSLHGYYLRFISDTKWREYLGSLLLCNPPTKYNEEIIDARWIGHSLEHGFSALRWSLNTSIYKSMPKLVGTDYIYA